MGLFYSMEDIALCEIYIKVSFLNLKSVTCLKLPLWSLSPFSPCFMAVSIAEFLYLKEKAVIFFSFIHYLGVI